VFGWRVFYRLVIVIRSHISIFAVLTSTPCTAEHLRSWSGIPPILGDPKRFGETPK